MYFLPLLADLFHFYTYTENIIFLEEPIKAVFSLTSCDKKLLKIVINPNYIGTKVITSPNVTLIEKHKLF